MTMDDGQSVESRRRRGLLGDLGERQSYIRELMHNLEEDTDQLFMAAAARAPEFNQEAVVACVLNRLEMDHAHPERPPEPIDVVWAIEFMDHLDTQGFTITPKNTPRRWT